MNTGIEQEHLDGLSNPQVTVTALSAGATAPHLELLCYRRRATPAFDVSNVRDNDIAATRMVWQSRAASAPSDGEPQSVTLVDPDGHRVLIIRT